jgi:hypothetical protein
MTARKPFRRSILLAAIIAALGISIRTADGGPLTYVVGNNDAAGTHHFGVIDLTSGAFRQIGPNAPVGTEGLAWGPNGSLLTLAYNSDLYSINPATGSYTLVGPTGLDDCTTPASPCGPTSNLALGGASGRVYVTDFQNRLYSVNPMTGAATLIGATGIPAIPFIPASMNPDGTINLYEEALFESGGQFYATFDAFALDLTTFTPTVAVAPALYRIDTNTGLATRIAGTDLAIGAAVGIGSSAYGFNLLQGNVFTLDLASGSSTFITNTDVGAGTIRGAAATPEPASYGMIAAGLALVLVRRRQL